MNYIEWLELQPPAATDERIRQAYLAGRADFRDAAIAAVTPPADIEKIDPYIYRAIMNRVNILRGMK
jgi:hypothetical protein